MSTYPPIAAPVVGSRPDPPAAGLVTEGAGVGAVVGTEGVLLGEALGVGLLVSEVVGVGDADGDGEPVGLDEAVGVGGTVTDGVGSPEGGTSRPIRLSGTWASPSSAWAVARRHWSRKVSAMPSATASVNASLA